MFQFLTTLEFGSASALFVATLTPLLLLAYFQKSSRKRFVVSSVLILRSLPKQPSLKRRLKLPLRFFLELLALLLLSLAAALPSLRETTPRVAILLDNSISMRARLSDPLHNQSRFDKAKTEIADWLRSQSAENRYTLFLASPRFARTGEPNLSAQELRSLLGQTETTLLPDATQTGERELAQSGEYDTLLVVSDRDGSIPASMLLGNKPVKASSSVYSLNVGEPVQNVFVSDIRLERSSLTGPADRLVVTASASARGPVVATLDLYGMAEKQTTLTRPVTSRSVTLPADRPEQFTFDVSTLGSYRAFVVRLSPNSEPNAKPGPRSSDSLALDALEEDNTAWISREPARETKYLLVTPQSAAEDALGLNLIPGIRVETVAPATFAGLSEDSLEAFSLILFHRTAPVSSPLQPSLTILPPAENKLFPVRLELASPRVSSWREDHPLTQYLRVPLIQPSGSVIFEQLPWAQSVINVEQGPVVLAGEQNGVRLAAVGFELLPYEGAKTPAPSVFLLNTVNWLTNSKPVSNRVPENLSFPVNVFLPQESSTYETFEYDVLQTAERNVSGLDRKPLAPQLLEVVLALLVIELLLRLRPRRQTA